MDEKNNNPEVDQGKATPETLHKRKVAMIVLGTLFLILALIWLIYWLIWGQFELYTDDAYVNGNMVQLMPQIPGTVIKLKTDEAQWVEQGQILLELDPTDYQIDFQKAKANLAQTVRQVRQYFENAAKTKQQVILDKANLVKAQLDLKRRLGLSGNRAVSSEELEHYRTALKAAQATFDYSLHQKDAALALVEQTHLYTHPLVTIAKDKLKVAYLNLGRTKIAAPVSGYVAQRSVQVGQQVTMSTVMLAIIPLNETWVNANYKENALEYIRAGQPVILYADAYPGFTYHGTVVGLTAGTGSAFALLPPQNATGNWIKIVQRLPVRISLDPQDLKKNPLQLGLSMRVSINIHNVKGSRLAKPTEAGIKFQTHVYEKQFAEVRQLIQEILQANAPDMYLPKEVS